VTNAIFGMARDGNFYIGYLDWISIQKLKFVHLINGVVWLVKNRKNYVWESIRLEEMSTQTSGNGTHFVNLKSSRIGLCHDDKGKIMIVQVDGMGSIHKGFDLNELANYLIDLGGVNCINLDGGGSSATAIAGNLMNFPSDRCINEISDARCERKVTTITCIY
jgi:N-acetylglucosamine-1-phosphodiester alpha-N-acetylglucosaminidase